jgi:hypothetical protein
MSGSVVGLATYAVLLAVNPAHPLSMGTLAQGVSLAIPLALHALAVRRWMRAVTGVNGLDLEALARRLSADGAWWSKPAPEPLDPQRQRLAPSGLEHLIRHSAESTMPDLVIQSPSDRPQPRSNIESLSAIIVPKPESGRVAVLVRRSVRPLTPSDLEQAVRLLRAPASEAEGTPAGLQGGQP